MNVLDLTRRLREDRSLLAAELEAIDAALERCEERINHSYMSDTEVGRLQKGDEVHRIQGGTCVAYVVNVVATKGSSHEAYAAYRGPGGQSVIRITSNRNDVHTPDRCPAKELGAELAPVLSLRAARARRAARKRREAGD